jgi:hypothetical protein
METIMTNAKTLMLAAFAALSLSAGSAMAQDGSGGGMDYLSQQNVIAAQRAATPNRTLFSVPSGSSDVEQEKGSAHSPEFIFQHHLYGAGGVAG